MADTVVLSLALPPTGPIHSLADEELLDALDPLRHLRESAAPDVGADSGSTLLPAQPPSVLNEITQLAFPLPPASNVEEHVGARQDSIAIQLVVDASPGCGGVAWPAGEVLARYIARRGLGALAGRNVLELGSGTGLVGLVAAHLGARVWITDQAPLYPIMERNIAFNDLARSVTPAVLAWGEPIPSSIPPPSIILAADCVYFEPAFPLLVQTLADLTPTSDGPDPEILFCYKKRRKADKRFFALLKKKFTWTDIDDDPEHALYSKEAISLLRLHPKR